MDASIASQLSVFDEEAPAADLPEPILAYLDSESAEGAATDPELARKVRVDAGDFYLVPGDGVICGIGGGAMACGSSAELSKQPLGYMLFGRSEDVPDGMVVVRGIAADNVERVSAVQPDGRRIDVHISGNAYATAIPTSTVRIEMQTADLGVLTTTLPDAVKG